jgi:hypothetical protein
MTIVKIRCDSKEKWFARFEIKLPSSDDAELVLSIKPKEGVKIAQLETLVGGSVRSTLRDSDVRLTIKKQAAQLDVNVTHGFKMVLDLFSFRELWTKETCQNVMNNKGIKAYLDKHTVTEKSADCAEFATTSGTAASNGDGDPAIPEYCVSAMKTNGVHASSNGKPSLAEKSTAPRVSVV